MLRITPAAAAQRRQIKLQPWLRYLAAKAQTHLTRIWFSQVHLSKLPGDGAGFEGGIPTISADDGSLQPHA